MFNDDWRARVLGSPLPDSVGWQEEAYADYRRRVLQVGYPCFFGQKAEQGGEIFYAFVPKDKAGALLCAMDGFINALSEERFSRFSLIAFFEHEQLATHGAFISDFWSALQQLSNNDCLETAIDRNADDPLWEFSYRGTDMFVVGLSETYQRRRSRRIASGMALIFQPRILFIDPESGEPLSLKVRQAIHRRMREYDGMDVHPDIGIFGSPANREWKQYVLPDDTAPTLGTCPFRSKNQKQANND